MSNQPKSPRLEGETLKLIQQQKTFSLEEAAKYWAGYLEISHGDKQAGAESKVIYNMLEQAAKSGQFGKRVSPGTKYKVQEDDADFASTRWDDPPPQRVVVEDWHTATVTREALQLFAESKGQNPAFLFPAYEFSDREAPTLANMLAALIVSKYGDNALNEMRKHRSSMTGKIITALENAGCTLDHKTMRNVLKNLHDPR